MVLPWYMMQGRAKKVVQKNEPPRSKLRGIEPERSFPLINTRAIGFERGVDDNA